MAPRRRDVQHHDFRIEVPRQHCSLMNHVERGKWKIDGQQDSFDIPHRAKPPAESSLGFTSRDRALGFRFERRHEAPDGRLIARS
jgi:hypothetical protein